MNIHLIALFRLGIALCLGFSSQGLGRRDQSVAVPCRKALVGLTLLLAGLGIGGGVGAQTPDPMPRSETVSDSAELDGYCESLNMATPICNRLGSIVFSRTGDGDLRWDENHPSTAEGGGPTSVLSPIVAAGDYSCMSLNFSPSLPADLNVYFHWALSRGGDSGSAHMQLFVAPPVGHVPMATMEDTDEFIQRDAAGFSPWTQYLAGKTSFRIPEIKWCYFGANASPGNEDRGRIDRLRLNASISITDGRGIAEYCTALNINNCSLISRLGFAGPLRLAPNGLTWDSAHVGSALGGGNVSVASPPVASEYSCMSIYFDPPLAMGEKLSFEWSLNTDFRSILRFYAYGSGEGGDDQPPIDNDGFQSSTDSYFQGSPPANGFNSWQPVKWTLGQDTGELRWCYFGESSAVSERNLGRIDRLVLRSGSEESSDDTAVLAEYCEALNMSEQLCGRLSSIVFSSNDEDIVRLPWDHRHGNAAPGGGDRSVISPTVDGNNSYSCMSLRFDPAISADLGVSFAWSVGQGGRGTTRMQLFVAPPDGHDPALATTTGTADFIERLEAGFGAWTSHSVPGLSASSLSGLEPVSELKWCYLGVSASSRGRIDRLRLIVASAVEDRTMIASYCTELGVPDEQCNFLQRVDFVRRGEAEERWQTDTENMRILSAPAVAKEQYSCMSIHFEPPIFPGTNLSFTWSITQSDPNSEPNKGQFWLAPGPMQEPEFDSNGNTLESTGTDSVVENFSVQTQSELSELRWCFFGENQNPLSADVLSLSTLALSVGAVRYDGREDINRYCSALDMSTSSCERLRSIVFTAPGQDQATVYGGNLVWPTVEDAAPEGGAGAVSARFANPYPVACMSLNFDPPWPAGTGIDYWHQIATLPGTSRSGLQFWPNPPPDHNPRIIDANSPYSIDTDSVISEWKKVTARGLDAPISEVKWCYFYGHNAHRGTVDRLAFGLDSSEETVSDTMVLGEYCEALNISDTVCARVSGIVFSRTGIGAIRWDENHPSTAGGGGPTSVLSPIVAAGDYSCMSLNFSPSLPADLNVYFYWALSRGGDSGSAHMQLFVAPPVGHVPMATMEDTDEFIQRDAAGFSPWTQYLAGKTSFRIPEIKWCYFGANASPGNEDRGRIDRLRLNASISITDGRGIAEYCTALNTNNCSLISRLWFTGPLRLGLNGLTWDSAHVGGAPGGAGISVASPPVASEYSCMSIYFDPPLVAGQQLSFEWSLSTRYRAAMRFYAYGLGEGGDDQPPVDNNGFQSSTAFRRGLGTSSSFNSWEPVERTLGQATGELRWCYFGEGSIISARDVGRIDRLVFGSREEERFSDTVVLAGYCEALNMTEQLCGRLSSIVFTGIGVRRLPWDERHGVAPSGGGDRSVISPAANQDSYSCMSLRFDPAISADSGVSFAWSLGRDGRGEGDTRVSRLQLFVAPPDGHDPALATTTGTADFIERLEDGFGAWTSHSVPGLSASSFSGSEPVSELKWCYFGADTTNGADDRGRIDRLRLIVASQLSERPMIAPYCTELGVSDEQCNFLQRVDFVRRGEAEERWQTDTENMRILSAPAVAKEQYSCMSIHFEPPIFPGTNLSFTWSITQSNPDAEPNKGQFWLAPGPMQEPEFDSNGNTLEAMGTDSVVENFSVQTQSELSELRWCFFGGNPSPQPTDALSLSALALSIGAVRYDGREDINRYCSALDMPTSSCERLRSIVFTAPRQDRAEIYGGNLVWPTVEDAAPEGGASAVSARFSNPYPVACMSLNFDPPWSAGSGIEYWLRISRPAPQLELADGGMQLFLNPGRFHNPETLAFFNRYSFVTDLEESGWVPLRRRGFGGPIDEVKWCYFYEEGDDGQLNNGHTGVVDRLALGPDSSEETVSDTTVLGEYCEALNIADTVCARVSGIVFSRTGIGDLRWDDNHNNAPQIGGGRSVLSPVVSGDDYSCMSLNFSPPLPADLNIFFHWALSRGGDSGSTHMQLFVAPPENHVPMATMAETDDFIQRDAVGFSSWARYFVGQVDAAIPELKWCFFGPVIVPEAGSLDGNRGRLDRLRLSGLSSVMERPEIARYCIALNISEEQCMGISRIGFASPFRLADLTWDPIHVGGAPGGGGVSVASPPMIAAREEYSCMSLYFAPPLPLDDKISFEWALNRESGGGNALLRFYLYGPDEGGEGQPPIDSIRVQSSTAFRGLMYAPGGGGFSEWGVVRRTLSEAAGELRWCYFGANFPAGERDQGRIDRLVFGSTDTVTEGIVSDTAALDEYCAALNMSERLCGQLSSIVFSGTEKDMRLPWDENHAVAPSRGGDRSVISQAASENNYSCMSLRFDPPIAVNSDVSFDWSVGRKGRAENDTRVSRLQLFVAPPEDHDPSLATTDGTRDFIERLEDGYSAWTAHSLPRVSTAIPELKWCYFGADITKASGDQGRIDRLRLNVVNSFERSNNSELIAEYCTALNVPEARCSGISGLAFAGPFRLVDFAWSSTHTGSPPAGGGISVASPIVPKGDYSCMSIYFDPPLPNGHRISFEWDLSREDEEDSGSASLHLYYFAPGEGDSQSPVFIDGGPAISRISRSLQGAPASGDFDGWKPVGRTLGQEIGELRWCYFGANFPAGVRDQGRIDRLVFGPEGSSNEDIVADTAVLTDYCAAMNMSEQLCGQLSGIVFSGIGVTRLPWDENHDEGSSGGGGRSVRSPIVGRLNYSCMSLRFDPSISMNSDVYFDWSAGSGEANSPGHLQLFVAPPEDHTPMASTADTANFIQYLPNPSPAPGDTGDATPLGFGPWKQYAVRGVSASVPELKWCYFGSTSDSGDTDRGRIDRLGLIVRSSVERSDRPEEIAEYCAALDVPEAQCAHISRLGFASPLREDLLWDNAHAGGAPGGRGVSVASPMISSREYSCMSVYFDPPVPAGQDIAFEWAVGREMGLGQLRLLAYHFAPGTGDDHMPEKGEGGVANYSLDEGSGSAGFRPWRRQGFSNLSTAVGELKWCYFGANSTAGELDRGRVDRLAFAPANTSNEESFSEPAVLGEYCDALNMSEQFCDQLSSIVFSGTGVTRLLWDDNHDEAPTRGGDRSVASPAVSKGNYSCMSLRFDPPISAGLNLLFSWSVGRDGVAEDDTSVSRLLLWAPPPENHAPMVTTDTAGFIQRSEDGFSNWIQHVGRSEGTIPELKWCYFGAGDSARSEDLGRIDRLRLTVSRTVEDRTVIDRYCTALNVPGAQCRQISHLAFSGPHRLQNVAWDSEHAVAAPGAGGDRSVLSQPVGDSEDSCMSLYFAPLLPAGRDVVFSWDFGRGMSASSDSVFLRFFSFAPGDGDDHVVGDGRGSDIFRPLGFAKNFVGWDRKSKTVTEAVEELKWCYSGVSPTAGDQDVGRIDRLVLRTNRESLSDRTVLGEYCTALKMSAGLCAQLSSVVFTKNGFGGHVWDDRHAASNALGSTRSVASPAVAAGKYSCMSLHFSPPIATSADISFDWSLGRSGTSGTAQLQLFLAPPSAQTPSAAKGATGDFIRQSEDGFGVWMQYTLRTEEPVPELKWCYFGAKGAPTVEDIGRIDQLSVRADSASLSERADLAEYCTALNMSEQRCAILSRIGFDKAAGSDDVAVWDPFHAAGSVVGDDRSVASPAVGAGDYSCMSLYFSRSLPTSSDISFDWSLGRGGGSGNAQLQLFVAPPPDQLPMATTDGTANFIQRSAAGFGAWMPHTVRTEDTVADIRWCYFGANSNLVTEDLGRIDRLAIRIGSESLSDSAVLQEYCTALNMPASFCARLSRIDFIKTGPGDHIWDHSPAEELVGSARSVVSPITAAGDYSCMSLRFDPPFPANSAAAFSVFLGRGGVGSVGARLQLFLNPPDDHNPLMATTDDTAKFIERFEEGFGAAEQLSARSEAPITAIQWCYFGVNPDPVAEDRGRIDALRIHAWRAVDDRPVIDRYCLALNVPDVQCSGISRIAFANLFPDANLAWDSAHAAGAPGGGGVSVVSPKVSRSQYSCMSVYFDPPVEMGSGIAFEWDLSREPGYGSVRLRVWRFAPGAGYQHIPVKGALRIPDNYTIFGGGKLEGFQRWRRVNYPNLSSAVGELKWCYFGESSTAGDRDRGRVDRLAFGPANTGNEENFSDSAVLAEYCAALNMSAPLCNRLSGIVFSGTNVGRLSWDDRHGDVPAGGGDYSVVSPAVSAGNYSCMSLRFSPPIATSSDISFDWSVGRDGVAAGDTRVGRLQLFVALPDDHNPLMAITDDTADFIQRLEDGFSAWAPHSVRRVSAPVPELKWCYFGADSTRNSEDRGRVDRLRLNVESSVEERTLIAGYCNALSLPKAHCERIDRIVFSDPIGFEGLAWDFSLEVGSPGRRYVSLVARRSSCMSLVFDPPWSPFADVSFLWDVGSSAGTEPAGLRLELNLDNENFFDLDFPSDLVGGEHTRAHVGEGLAGWLRYSRNDFPEPLEQLRWCYRSGRAAPQPQDRARFALLQLQEDERLSLVERDDISPYCKALNMPDWNCERIRYISFDSGDQARPMQWDAEHPMGSPNGGGDVAVASPPVALGDYSCLSLHFDPPLAADSRLRFAWSAGRSSPTETSRMRLWLNPGYGHSPLRPARGPVLDYDGGGAWQSSATVDIGVAVEEAKWCVLGANLNPSPDDIGRLDAIRFGPYRELISARDSLDQYCADSGLEGICADLSRIVFSRADTEADAKWAIRDGDLYGLSSPEGSPGEESCMRMEFDAPAAAAVGRFVFGWSLTGPAGSRLRVYRGAEALPVLEFAPSDAGAPGSFPTATVWVARSAEAPNYLLSWCHYLPEDAGAGSAAARAILLGMSVQQLRAELTVAAPIAGSRVELAEHLAHVLRVDILLSDVLEMTQSELVPAAAVRLKSRADMVYQLSAGTLQPLDWRVSLDTGSYTNTATLYLPQAVVAREQLLRLFSVDGALLTTTTITVPAVLAEDSEMLAINRLCRGGRLLAANTAMTVCPLLALPGNGFGDWMTASETASVRHLAPSSLEVAAGAGPSRCLRMLVGISASQQESSAVQIRFRWRGPPPGSGVELGFYTGQSDVAVALAPSSGMPVSGSLLLTQRPEGQQLGWCLEGSSSLASAMGSDWGWFPTDPIDSNGFMLRAAGIAPPTVNSLLAALPYLQECTEQGRRPVPACLQMIDDVPESLKRYFGLADDVAVTEEIILLWSTLQWLTERGELDVNRDGNQDEQDLRLWLRYQAGLRGESLSQDPVDEARLVERLGP